MGPKFHLCFIFNFRNLGNNDGKFVFIKIMCFSWEKNACMIICKMLVWLSFKNVRIYVLKFVFFFKKRVYVYFLENVRLIICRINALKQYKLNIF